MWMRLNKIILIALASFYATLVAFNNITDYHSNFQFVQHVLSMDTTFDNNLGVWRAIATNALHHVAYMAIIATEILIAVLGWAGVFTLWQARHSAKAFNRKKIRATQALVLGICLWFGGFIIIGGEWFLMWQSEIWNGIEASFRVSVIFALFLIILNRRDEDALG